MSKPRLLDLFRGAGGATRGYQNAGFVVTGVDIHPQPHYCGDFFQQGDALTLDINWNLFDAVHASPPCQRYSTMSQRWNGKAESHPALIEPIRKLLQATGLPYIIENVPGAPLLEPIRLCGSSFGLGVRRHRLFEGLNASPPPCEHSSQPPKYRVYDHGRWYLARTVPVYGTGGGKAREHWPAAMGIDWMERHELAEAIPPAYTEWIGAQLIANLEKAA